MDIFVFDDQRVILAQESGRRGTRSLAVPEQTPGSRLFVLALPKDGSQRTKDLKLKFGFGQTGMRKTPHAGGP